MTPELVLRTEQSSTNISAVEATESVGHLCHHLENQRVIGK